MKLRSKTGEEIIQSSPQEARDGPVSKAVLLSFESEREVERDEEEEIRGSAARCLQ